jgi:hypothetical protein
LEQVCQVAAQEGIGDQREDAPSLCTGCFDAAVVLEQLDEADASVQIFGCEGGPILESDDCA